MGADPSTVAMRATLRSGAAVSGHRGRQSWRPFHFRLRMRCQLLRNGVKAILFGCQRCVSALCDDLPEFRRKLVAVTSQPLIKRAVRPDRRLLSRFLVLRGFALVLL